MRNITVNGQDYKWKVGRKNILVINQMTKSKHLFPIPENRTEWAVVYWNPDVWRYANASICDTLDKAEAVKNSSDYPGHPAFIYERSKSEITPAMIKALIVGA